MVGGGGDVAHTIIGKWMVGHQMKGFLVYVCVDVVPCITGGLLHELSNDGAREQFNVYLEDKILLQMVVASRVSPIQCFVHSIRCKVHFRSKSERESICKQCRVNNKETVL